MDKSYSTKFLTEDYNFSILTHPHSSAILTHLSNLVDKKYENMDDWASHLGDLLFKIEPINA